jgi:hypothetical protein
MFYAHSLMQLLLCRFDLYSIGDGAGLKAVRAALRGVNFDDLAALLPLPALHVALRHLSSLKSPLESGRSLEFVWNC